ncbi:oligosaccharide flippase family protein [Tenacibaculum maritimum]|uniref:lipopolysaccharide biosynthesis protein n=1 Tax=Tenacibaculum maritimum TaxID=107401 RepID=UPI002306F0A1|nr:oligosaccharide flippase family protein [Tenacibaculum maritimum]
MKSKLKNLLPKEEFSKNVLTLITGTAVAQALPVAISPILTRLYTPEEFGIFSIFFAIIAIFGVVANGRYELAVMLPEKEEDAINILALGFIINSLLSLVLLILIILFQNFFVEKIGVPEIKNWLYLVPFTVFFVGGFNMLSYFNTRYKRYKDIAKATAIKSFVMAVIQLSLGFLKVGVGGLISGHVFSQLFANVKLSKNIFFNPFLVDSITKIKVKEMGIKYQRFPKYSLGAIFANTVSQHYGSILISSFYSVSTLGFYSLSQRVLGIPSAFIGKSVSQVYFEEAVREKKIRGNAFRAFRSTVKKNFIIGICFFFPFYFIVEELFLWVFGVDWIEAGGYTKILIPFFFIRFVVAPVTVTNSVFEKQDLSLYWQLGFMISVLTTIFLSNSYGLSVKEMLQFLSSVSSGLYIILFIILYRVSKCKL